MQSRYLDPTGEILFSFDGSHLSASQKRAENGRWKSKISDLLNGFPFLSFILPGFLLLFDSALDVSTSPNRRSDPESLPLRDKL